MRRIFLCLAAPVFAIFLGGVFTGIQIPDTSLIVKEALFFEPSENRWISFACYIKTLSNPLCIIVYCKYVSFSVNTEKRCYIETARINWNQNGNFYLFGSGLSVLGPYICVECCGIISKCVSIGIMGNFAIDEKICAVGQRPGHFQVLLNQ